MMKKFFSILCFAAVLITACSPQGMQGHPAAIQAGAAVGGVLGSIVGDRAGGYYGSQFGALIGTVAGVAVGNAISTPRQHDQEGYSVQSRSYPSHTGEVYDDSSDERTDPVYAETPTFSGLRILNIRFIDGNRNHVIDAEENSKLVFDIVNEGDVPVYNITPVVEEVGGMKHLFISPSAQISYMEVGNQIRYTVTIRGGRRLKSGQAQFRVFASESNGATTRIHTFSLPTLRRSKR